MSTDKPHLIRLDNQDIRALDRKVVLGRHPGCDYVISLNDRNTGISGRHATVEAQGDVAWLEDLGSTNGTWMNGERIAKRTRLEPGDRFQLDRLEFEFRAPVKPVTAPPPPAPKSSTTVAIGIEDLALPSPAPMQPASKPQPVKAAPPPPPPPPPPPSPPPVKPVPPPAPPEPALPPVVEVVLPVVEAKPVQPPPEKPATIELKIVEAEAPPPPAPAPPPPPRPEPVKAEAAKPAPAPASPPENKSATRPQKVAGAWISAEHSGKTKVLLPGERDRLKEQMGAELYAGAEAISVPTLLFAEPEGRRVTLAQRNSATQEWSIGSNPDADVSIPQDGLSGLHAKILRNGQTWTISDLMSANGTFVNGEKINRSHLESGNQLGFGPVLCTFLLPDGVAAPRPATAPAARKKSALPLPLLLGGGVLALALIGIVLYLLLR